MHEDTDRNSPGEETSHHSPKREDPFSDPVSNEEYAGLAREREGLVGAAKRAQDGDQQLRMQRGGGDYQGQWLRYAGLGVQMLVMMLLPAAGGFWLDSAQGTGPFGLIVGLMLGIGLGMYSVIAFVARSEKRESGSPR